MNSSFVDLGLSFLEGVGLIVSPCILPLLPLILSTSIEGGKSRPYGIILGFVFSFSLFVFLSRELVSALNIDLDYIKYGSLFLLGAIGLTLLSETLSSIFSAVTQRAASLGARLSPASPDGFVGSLGVGALIGLVWTPCAGPFLAAVLVQAILQETDLGSLLVLFSFSLGVGVPMLLISLTGRQLVNKLGFFKRHAAAVRKFFGVLILLAVLFIASGVDALTLFQSAGPPSTQRSDAMKIDATPPTSGLTKGLATPYPAPEFDGLTNWLNSEPLTMASLKGKVVLIDFWTYSCINCVRTLPYIKAWDEKYSKQGLVIIGVHAPEFAFEKKLENVKDAVAKYGIRYPVVQDNTFVTWRKFNNRFWPAHYLIDQSGHVVYTHFGEGEYDTTENNIRALLGVDKITGVSEPKTQESLGHWGQTPETYLGAVRAERNANGRMFHEGTAMSFSFPSEYLKPNEWVLDGRWSVDHEKIVSTDKGSKLRLHFNAATVFLVMGTAGGQPVKAQITLNGQPLGASAGLDAPDGVVTVNHNTLYELIRLNRAQSGLLEITADSPGLEAYAFTFGS